MTLIECGNVLVFDGLERGSVAVHRAPVSGSGEKGPETGQMSKPDRVVFLNPALMFHVLFHGIDPNPGKEGIQEDLGQDLERRLEVGREALDLDKRIIVRGIGGSSRGQADQLLGFSRIRDLDQQPCGQEGQSPFSRGVGAFPSLDQDLEDRVGRGLVSLQDDRQPVLQDPFLSPQPQAAGSDHKGQTPKRDHTPGFLSGHALFLPRDDRDHHIVRPSEILVRNFPQVSGFHPVDVLQVAALCLAFSQDHELGQ